AVKRGSTYSTVTWNGTAWSGYTNLGGPPVGVTGGLSDPAIISWAPGRIDVWIRGGDGKLWQNFSTHGGNSLSGWFRPLADEGALASAAAPPTRGPGRLDVGVVGTDNNVSRRFGDGGWNEGWITRGRPPVGILGDPTAVSWDSNRVDLFVWGGDGKLW